MRWRRIFYHAPSTRINSKHDSVVDWGLHGGNWLSITNTRSAQFCFLPRASLLPGRRRKSHSFDFINLLKQKIEFLWMRWTQREEARDEVEQTYIYAMLCCFINQIITRSRRSSFMAFCCQSHPLIAVSMPYRSSTDLATSAGKCST